jgi:hypothetical protein
VWVPPMKFMAPVHACLRTITRSAMSMPEPLSLGISRQVAVPMSIQGMLLEVSLPYSEHMPLTNTLQVAFLVAHLD